MQEEKMTHNLYSLIMLFTVSVFLMTGNIGKAYAQKNNTDPQPQNCINNLEDILNSIEENVNFFELSNERIQDINEVKKKYHVFKLQCYSIMRAKNRMFAKRESCIRKCNDLISDFQIDVNKILMGVDGWSTGG